MSLVGPVPPTRSGGQGGGCWGISSVASTAITRQPVTQTPHHRRFFPVMHIIALNAAQRESDCKKTQKSGVFASGIGYSFRLTKYFSKASLFSAQIVSSICRLTRCQRTVP